MKLPLVTVVALCYNQSSYLLGTLDSIKQQSYPNIELIVIDDASKDNSVQIIKDWIKNYSNPVTSIFHDKNKGICYSLNEALSMAKGKYVSLVACDDHYLPFRIEYLIEEFEKLTEDYALLYSDVYLMDENGSRLNYTLQEKYDSKEKPEGFVYDTLIKSNFIPAVSSFYRKSAIDNVGGYDEKIKIEDYDMNLRLAQKYKFKYVDKITAVYRIHSQSFTNSPVQKPTFLKASNEILLRHYGINKKYDHSIKSRLIDNTEKLLELSQITSGEWIKYRLKVDKRIMSFFKLVLIYFNLQSLIYKLKK